MHLSTPALPASFTDNHNTRFVVSLTEVESIKASGYGFFEKILDKILDYFCNTNKAEAKTLLSKICTSTLSGELRMSAAADLHRLLAVTYKNCISYDFDDGTNNVKINITLPDAHKIELAHITTDNQGVGFSKESIENAANITENLANSSLAKLQSQQCLAVKEFVPDQINEEGTCNIKNLYCADKHQNNLLQLAIESVVQVIIEENNKFTTVLSLAPSYQKSVPTGEVYEERTRSYPQYEYEPVENNANIKYGLYPQENGCIILNIHFKNHVSDNYLVRDNKKSSCDTNIPLEFNDRSKTDYKDGEFHTSFIIPPDSQVKCIYLATHAK